MNAEFNWWLLIVGLVIGAGLVYLVLADSSRRDADVLADELPREATWISASMAAEGRSIDPPTAERVLELHRAYLAGPPPDPEDDETFEPPRTSERGRDRGAEPEPTSPVGPSGPDRRPDRGTDRPGAAGSALRDDPHVDRDAP